MCFADKKKRKRRRPNRTGFPREVSKKKPIKKVPYYFAKRTRIRNQSYKKPNPNTGLQGDYWKQPLAKKRGILKTDENCPATVASMKKVEKPVFLPIGSKVSARWKGAFCMATVKNIDKQLRITVSIRRQDGTTGPSFLNIAESDIISIKGNVYYLANNVNIEIKDPVSGETVEAVIRHINDQSKYQCVFDDGDVAILKRSSLVPQIGANNTTPSTERRTGENNISNSIPSTSSSTMINQEVPILVPEAIRVDDALRASSSSNEAKQSGKAFFREKRSHCKHTVIHNDLEEEIDSKPPKLIPQATSSWEHDDDIVLLAGNGATLNNQEESLAVLPKAPLSSSIPSTSTNGKMNETEPSIVKVKITFADNPTKKYLIKVQKKPSEITLSDLKKNMPVPGNFRFFVRNIDEEDGECLFEEFLNESDSLPLYDGQIVVECMLK